MTVEEIRTKATGPNDFDDCIDANAAVLSLLSEIDALASLCNRQHLIIMKYEAKYGDIE